MILHLQEETWKQKRLCFCVSSFRPTPASRTFRPPFVPDYSAVTFVPDPWIPQVHGGPQATQLACAGLCLFIRWGKWTKPLPRPANHHKSHCLSDLWDGKPRLASEDAKRVGDLKELSAFPEEPR